MGRWIEVKLTDWDGDKATVDALSVKAVVAGRDGSCHLSFGGSVLTLAMGYDEAVALVKNAVASAHGEV